MKGLSLNIAKAIEELIEGTFSEMSLSFLGIVPKIKKDKTISFSTTKNSITSIFLEALATLEPTKDEEDTLKVLLKVANGYVHALEDRTKSKIINSLDSYIRDQSSKKKTISYEFMRDVVTEEMGKAKNHFKLIANTESNKASNMGTALQVAKFEDDPVVFFSIIDDERTGFYEYILHTLPDRKTPRVWKLSEIQSGYYKNGDQYPAIPGLHPNCRCKITYLARFWGFSKDGKIKYIGKDHDEFKLQREKYGLPNVPKSPRKKNGEWIYSKNI